MRFSLLCSGEWALSFYICVFIYTGVSLNLETVVLEILSSVCKLSLATLFNELHDMRFLFPSQRSENEKLIFIWQTPGDKISLFQNDPL